jgi:hypothetical protein
MLRVDRTTVVRWERGDCEPQPWLRRPLATALEVSLDQLHAMLAAVEVDGSSPDRGTVVTGSDVGGDVTDRRSFSTLAALASIGLAEPLRDALLSSDAPRRVQLGQVQQARQLVDRLRETDSIVGANEPFRVRL